MFSHIILGARDLDRQMAFYDAVLPHIGLIRRAAEDDGGPAGSRGQQALLSAYGCLHRNPGPTAAILCPAPARSRDGEES